MFVTTACHHATNHEAQAALSADIHHWQNVYSYGEVKQVGDELHLISTGNWFLLSKETYSDFIFEAEVKMPDTSEYSNSGILFRAGIRDTEKGKDAWGYQAEIDPSDRKWSGGFYEQGHRQWLHPLHETRSFPDADFKQNYLPEWDDEKANAYRHLEWNSYRIEAIGEELKIWVNDVLTTHVRDARVSTGYIGIQHHGSHGFGKTGDRTNTIIFRNIRLIEK